MVRRQLGKLLAIGTVAAMLVTGGVLAVMAQTAPTTVPMVPTGDSSLSGSVTFTPLGGNQVKVDVTVNGLKPNDDRADHIHSPGTGTPIAGCDSGGPVVYPFNDVKADASGKGTSSTTITIDPSKGIPTKGWYVNVHQGTAPNVGSGVICAPISTPLVAGAAAAPSPAAGAGTGGTAAPGNLPNSGDSVPTATLLGALVLAGIVLTGAGVLLRRHRA
ncbi:MAG TPA: CHRD domain-containing protein [Dehalococcoidia bacterium]|nr:CHRD domain-containing protein [Dehalococcoidia bacterium]